MFWHAELTFDLRVLSRPGVWLRTRRLTLRGYWTSGADNRHDKFAAVMQAQIEDTDSSAFLSGLLRVDGSELRRDDYRALAKLLHGYGVVTALADRGDSEPAMFDVARWAA